MSRSTFNTEGKRSVRAALNDVEMDRKAHNKRKAQIIWAAKTNYLNTVKIPCQLYRGEEKFPRQAEMTISEMGLENKKFVRNFIARMDRGSDNDVLWSWKIIDYKAHKKAYNEFVYKKLS